MYLKKVILGLVMLTVALSCAGVRPSQSGDLDEYLKSENNRMKKRITSLERDNSVLDKENKNLEQENARQYEKIQGLGKELEEWKARHERELAQMEERLRSLALEKAALEQESTEKIQELTRLHEEDKARHRTEVQGLNALSAQQAEGFGRERESLKREISAGQAALARQTEAFAAEKDALKSEAARKETAHVQVVDGLNRERDALRSELAAKDAVLSQHAQKLQTLTRETEEQSRKLQALSRELEEKGALVRKLEDESRSLRERLQAAENARAANTAATGTAVANPSP